MIGLKVTEPQKHFIIEIKLFFFIEVKAPIQKEQELLYSIT